MQTNDEYFVPAGLVFNVVFALSVDVISYLISINALKGAT